MRGWGLCFWVELKNCKEHLEGIVGSNHSVPGGL